MWLPLSVRTLAGADQTAEVAKLLVGNILGIYGHTLRLTCQEVRRVDGSRRGTVHRVKGVPMHGGIKVLDFIPSLLTACGIVKDVYTLRIYRY